LDFEDAGDRISRWEYAAETRRYEKVAGDDIGAVRQVRQAEPVAFARADGNGPDTVAIQRYGHLVTSVGDQQGFRRKRTHLDNLADDSICIEQRLPDEYAVSQAAIQVESLSVGIEVDAEDFRDEHAVTESLGRFEQLTQPAVFRLERVEALKAKIGAQTFALELLVLRQQGVALRNPTAQRLPRVGRHIDEHLDWVDDDQERLAHAREVVRLGIEQHEREANEREQCESGA
jgi:hypothetical protein